MGPVEIRFGLGAVKNVGEGAIASIALSRKEVGEFKSFSHFFENTDFHRVNRRVLESLVKSGAFDSLDPNRASLLASIDSGMRWATGRRKEKESGQASLFASLDAGASESQGFGPEIFNPWNETEKLAHEKEALGFYFSGHPLKTFEAEVRRASTSDTQLCQTLGSQTEVRLAGMIAATRIITTKKGSRMAFLTFEDLKGTLEVIVFSDVYQHCTELIGEDKPYVLTGQIDRTEDGVKIIAREIVLLADHLKRNTKSIHLKVNESLFTEERMTDLNHILDQFSGPCAAFLHLIAPGQTETVFELPKGVDLSHTEDLMARVNLLFDGNVVEYN